MIDSKNLILLDKEEAEIALARAMRGELDVYIIDTDRNYPFLLKIGDLEKIRRSIPRRTEIILEPAPPGTGISRFDRVGYLDLRIAKIKYEEIFKEKLSLEYEEKKKENTIPDNIDLLKNEYYLQLTAMAKEAICKYSEWKSNNSIRKNMMSLVVEPLLNKITSDTRDIEFLKRILKSEFKEL